MHIDKEKVIKHKKTLMTLYSVILCFFVLIFVLLAKMNWDNGKNGEFIALLISIILIFCGGILLINIVNKTGVINERDDNYLDYEKIKLAYEEVKKIKREISYIRHDIANHIQVINGLCDQMGSLYPADAIEQIQIGVEAILQIKYCDNILLDILLEHRIRTMRDKGLIVNTNIKLNGLHSVNTERVCAAIGLLIDNISERMVEGNSIYIDIHKHAETEDGIILMCNIEVEKDKKQVKTYKITNEEMKWLDYMFKRMNGSLVMQSTDEKYIGTGMMEVCYDDGE